MNLLKTTLRYIRHSSSLKYIVVTVVGVAIVGFIDENSVWNHIRNRQKIETLQDEITHYRNRYEHDKAQLRRLDNDPKAIEQIARERYFMKMDDEDIFVLSDEEPRTAAQTNETTE